MKSRIHPFRSLLRIAGTSLFAASFVHAIEITISDTTPNGDAGTGTRTLTTSGGSVTAPPVLPTTTYTLTGVDLTSLGGSAAEQIVFTVAFTQSGGTGVQYNGFGNVSVTGGDNNQVDAAESLTAAVSLVSTTFSGGTAAFNIGLTGMTIGGYGSGDVVSIIHDGGTITKSYASDTSLFVTFPASDALTLDPTAGLANLQAYTVKIFTGTTEASWTGASDTSWAVAGNWNPAGVPGSQTLIKFDSNSTANLATVLNQDFNIPGVVVTSPSGAVSIGGANSLTMGTGGIDLSTATQDLTITAPVVLGAAQPWSVASGRSLSVNGGVTGAFALSISGAGSVSLGAAVGPLTPITVASGGTLKTGASSVLASATTPAVNGTLDLNGTNQSVTAISGSGIIDNTAAGASQLTVANSSLFTLNVTLTDTAGTLALVKNGGGRLDLAKANTHSGGTTIHAGLLRPTVSNAIGSGPVTMNGGTFDSYFNSFSYANALTLSGSAVLQTSGGNNNTLNWNGPVGLAGDATLNANGGTSGVKIFGDVTNEGHTLSSLAGGTGNFISGKITGTGGNLTVTTGLLEISSTSNDYTGTTTVSAGILRLGASSVLPDATNVTLANGTLNANNNTDSAGTLTVSGTASINLGAAAGGTLAFAGSSALTWTGTLNITGTFTPGASLRFGTTANGLSSTQLAAITVVGGGSYTLNSGGYLVAAAGGSDYAAWASANTITGGETGDSDYDGVTNLVEYALIDGGERGVSSGDTLSFTKRGAPYGSDVTYVIEISTDLGITDSWETAVSGVTDSPAAISYTFTPGTPVRNFARLKVVKLP